MEALDAALDAAVAEVEAAKGQFSAELAAARALALSFESEPLPAAGLVTLRAGLAARRAAGRGTRRRQWLVSGVPGAAAAAVAGLFAFGALGSNGGAPGPIGVANAAETLQVINQRMAQVQHVVAQRNKPAAQAAGHSAQQALVQAQAQAVSLPSNDPVRDLLLVEADAKIVQLTQLLAELQIPAPTLPPVPSSTSSSSSGGQVASPTQTVGSGGSGSTTTTTSSSSSTTSTTSGSGSTTTTQPSSTTTTTTSPKTTTTTTPSSTTTTTSSTTTTTEPGSTTTSSTTSTTAASGGSGSDTAKPRKLP